jgi:dolichyl-phosphate-mannose--protein O-mannosyl transferase
VAAAWSRADSVALAAVTLAAAVLRGWRVSVPGRIVFDEAYYAPDACVLWRGQEACGVDGIYSRVHPYLAKWLIGAGIEVFGYRPFGWRVAAVAFGVLGIALLFVLARRLLRSTAAATLAAGLLAIDGLHFVQSRVAMLDVFVGTFSLATIVFVVLDRDRERRPGERLRDRPWLLAAGVAAGAAAASKWSGFPFLVVALVLVVAWDARAARDRGDEAGWVRTVRREAWVLVAAFAIVPAAVYVAAAIPGVDGRVLAVPWDYDAWPRAFLRWQQRILTFGVDLEGEYPYASPGWSWPLLRRPVVYALETEGGAYRHVLALGNPAIWWASIPAVAACAVWWVRRRGPAEAVVVAGVAAGYLWWIPATVSRPFSFIFYITPALPFMCLALAVASRRLWTRRAGRAVVAAGVAAAIASFAFFLPILSFQPLSADAWTARLWFTDCRPEALEGDPPVPQTREATPPPEGWCWI